ncbi:uncharacterized protein P174DRAFT_79870 [Aspergillus novofumigatus IBT 16806]|uniref:Uncharacterized protein n=1 Tax=Aspergillus novofumigatus (strain IBT 16806) TaxID=1392255 RepID=A0A2I1CFV6_ASPN1|nr:uncharacterized protein P174DRAFT_79870 [Aspergillus novofumigatus IBT 16806]PKX96504.1 hypothetical protein P174DRAFT_79870 [Aspergillus novofumigatus IBT 16806]
MTYTQVTFFVDKDNPTQITSIIDWQAVPIYPIFLVAHHPSLIEYDGPKPERFIQPSLPEDIEEFNVQDKKAAKELFLGQTLWLYYETQVCKEASDLICAFEYRKSLQSEILSLIGSIFDDGEPHVQRLLADVTKYGIRKQLVGEDDHGNPSVPCPLSFTEHDLEKQMEEYAEWGRDIEERSRVIDKIGVYTGWNGAVSPGDYDKVVRRVELVKERFFRSRIDNSRGTCGVREVMAFLRISPEDTDLLVIRTGSLPRSCLRCFPDR